MTISLMLWVLQSESSERQPQEPDTTGIEFIARARRDANMPDPRCPRPARAS